MSDHGRGEHSGHDVGETPPDSGEVCAATRTDRCERKSGHDGPHWPKPTEHATWKDDVLLPLSLAQRILAALDAAAADYERLKVYGATPIRTVAAELRERMPR